VLDFLHSGSASVLVNFAASYSDGRRP